MTDTAETVTSEEKIAILKKQNVFSQFTEAEITELSSLLTEKIFKAGDTIVNEGDIVDSIFLILNGRADVRHIILKDGVTKIRSLALMGPGQAIGLNDSGFYSLTGKRTATVVAITPMLTLHMSIPRFHGFALAYPHVSEVMRSNAEAALNSEK